MRKIITAFSLLIFSMTAWAAPSCPQLRGTFNCRANPPFALTTTEQLDQPFPAYTMSDPTGSHTFIVDNQFHPMTFSSGAGQYRAWCDGRSLMMEVHSPSGAIGHDRYYIERGGLVRVRIGPQHAESLSCAPTEGTWRLYR